MKRMAATAAALAMFFAGIWVGSFAADAPATATATATAASQAAATPSALIEQVAVKAIAILGDAKLSKEQKNQKMQTLAYDVLDLEALARLSLGKYWRTITAEQQQQFLAEFKKHLTATYSHITDDYTDEDIKVTGSHTEADGDATVDTQIIGDDNNGNRKPVAKVSYRIRSRDGQFKIIDVTVEGISLAQNFRSQFEEIMQNGGIDKLIKSLHDKNVEDDQNK